MRVRYDQLPLYEVIGQFAGIAESPEGGASKSEIYWDIRGDSARPLQIHWITDKLPADLSESFLHSMHRYMRVLGKPHRVSKNAPVVLEAMSAQWIDDPNEIIRHELARIECACRRGDPRTGISPAESAERLQRIRGPGRVPTLGDNGSGVIGGDDAYDDVDDEEGGGMSDELAQQALAALF